MLLGLTGNIACGKSTVSRMLAGWGATVLDADKLVHELYAAPEFAARVAALFTEPVLTSAGTVDRMKVAAVVFKDRAALLRLEALVHPAVAALRDQKIEELHHISPTSPIVLEAVKLIESGQATQCDAVWCVTCLPEVQRQRLMQDRGLSESAVRERLENQPSLDQKARLIGAIPLVMIENNGSFDMLETRVKQEWHKLLEGERA